MKRITIAGGDERLISVRSRLLKEGHIVATLGLFENDGGDISASDIVILPVPTTKDGINVYAPLTNRNISLSFVEDSLSAGQTVLCCGRDFSGVRCIDYGTIDSYAIANAVPTVEGAIKLAIENTPFTLFSSNVLVIGFGRVGKVLADRLKAMGCLVTVSSRRNYDAALIKALGMNSISTGELHGSSLDYDMIFNTVDAEVLSENDLERTAARLIMDLSSKGGFDLQKAKLAGITALKPPGLPGKTAPETAGEILADTLVGIIKTLEKE